MKMIIKYSRHGAVKYISHLDMQRAFGRAIRRAGIDAEYSHGFNPHIVMSFASPLSVGYETEGDYLELSLVSDAEPQAVMNALAEVMPPGLKVLGVHAATDGKKLMAQNESAAYHIKFHFKNDENCVRMNDTVQKIMAAESYTATDRRGRSIDIRPLIFEAECNKDVLALLLRNASDGALNPAVVATAIDADAEYDVCRQDCYAIVNGQRIPFSKI
ncbi:MAG: TIGR03936 family radical SAM-associated protein [Christensenella sp.]